MAQQQSCNIRKEDVAEYKQAFDMYDKDRSGVMEKDELKNLLLDLNINISNALIREDIHRKYGKDINFDEFMEIVKDYSSAQDGADFLKMIKKRPNLKTTGGTAHGSSQETTHTYDESEVTAFAEWINTKLKDDDLISSYLPIDSSPKSKDLFEKSGDGVLICKLINAAAPGTIDERVINTNKKDTFSKHENLSLAINSAKSIGCQIVNIGPDDLSGGNCHLILGMMWQIIRIVLFSRITIADVPGLQKLLAEDEDNNVLYQMTPEEILIRWVNYHLKAAESHREIENFNTDVMDSVVYYYLLKRIVPQDVLDSKNYSKIHFEAVEDDVVRAEYVLDVANEIQCKKFVTAKNIVEGNTKLNLAFVANLFNHYPALGEAPAQQPNSHQNDNETREERTYRNWMNSLGVNPFVTWLYTDLCDGTILLELLHYINKDVVSADQVQKARRVRNGRKPGHNMRELENCNDVVKACAKMDIQLTGIDGNNIHDGNELAIQGILHQMLRTYTVNLISGLEGADGKPVTKDRILPLVKRKLENGGKKPINSFTDPSIATSRPLIDLVDVISKERSSKRSIVKYDLIEKGDTRQVQLNNAKYALSLARKIGAPIYSLPEDLVDKNQKMVLTIFAACLLACNLAKAKKA